MNKSFVASLCMAGLVLVTASSSFATATNTTLASASLSADTAGAGGSGAYTTLNGPVLTEGANRDIGTGAIVLNAPAGFAFNPAATVNATVTRVSGTNSPVTLSATTGTVTTSSITITVSAQDTAGTTLSSITWSGIQVRPTAGTPLASGNITKAIGGSTITGITAGSTSFGTLTETGGAAAKLGFTTQPTNITAGVTMGSFVVQVRDQFTNAIAQSGTTVTLTLTGSTLFSGTNPRSTDANGKATFNDFVIRQAANGLHFTTANDGGLANTNSANFNITPAAASAYRLNAADTTPQAGIADLLTITLVDQYQNIVTNFTGTKSLTFSGLSAGANGTLPTVTDNTGAAKNFGTATTITFSNGVSAIGGNLVAHNPEGPVNLAVTDGTLSTATTGGAPVSLTVSVGNPSAYRFSAATTSPQAGASDALTIKLVDQYQNLITTFSGDKNLTFSGLSASTNGTQPTITDKTGTPVNLGTGTTITFASGLNSAGGSLVAYRAQGPVALTATDGTLSTATTGGTNVTLTVSATAQSALRLGAASATPTAGATDALTITAVDPYGNTVTNYTGVHGLTFSGLGNAPAGNVPTVAGVALGTATSITFANGQNSATVNLIAFKRETAALAVTDGTFSTAGAGGAPASLTVNAAAASAYRLSAATTTPQVGVADQLTISLVDQYQNVVTSFTGTKNLTFAGLSAGADGSLPTVTDNTGAAKNLGTATTITLSNGVSAIGGNLMAHKAEGPVNLTATDGTLTTSTTGGTPVSLTVSAATPTKLAFTTQPTNITAGVTMGSFVVQIQDQFRNAIAQSGTSITLTLNGSTLFSGTNPRTTDANGKATFNDFVIRQTGAGLNFTTANGAGLVNTNSTNFIVSAAAAATINVETAANGSGSTVGSQNITAGNSLQVFAITRDTFGNFAANPSSTWSLTNMTGGVASGNLTPSSGANSTFTGHFVGSAMVRVVNGALTNTSGTLTVVPGALAKYAVSATTPQTRGTAFNVTVTAQDANTNTVTGDSSTVVTLISSTGNLLFDGDGDSSFDNNTKTLSSGTFTISAKDSLVESLTITATDGNGKTGTSASIAVNPVSGDYRSAATGNWDAAASWQTWNGTAWVAAPSAPSGTAGINIAVLSGHTVTLRTQTGTLILNGNLSVQGSLILSPSTTLQVGSGGTAGSLSGNVTDNGALVFNRSDAVVYGGVVSGTGTLLNQGGGTLTLNAANTYSGDTRIAAGTVTLGNSSALQNSTLDMNGADNGTLGFGTLTVASFGGLKGSRDLGLQNAATAAVALTVGNNAASTAYSGVLSGSGSLTKVGTGTLTLAGNNTFGGRLTVRAGTVSIPTINDTGAAGPLGQSANAVALGWTNTIGTLEYTGATASSTKPFAIGANGDTSAFGSVIQVDTSGTVLTLSGQINQVNQALLTKTGPGTLILAGTDDNVGLGVLANVGTVVLAKTSNSGVHALGGAGFTLSGGTVQLGGTGGDQIYDFSFVTVNSGTYDFNGLSETSSSIAGSGGKILNNGGGASTMTVGVDNGSRTYSGAIADNTTGGGTMALVKIGTGTQTLGGTNTYTGTTTIKQGGVTLNGNTGHLADTSGVTFAGTGAFNYDNTGAAGAISETVGALTLSAGEATIQATRTALQNTTLTFSSLTGRAPGATANFVATGTGSSASANQAVLTGQNLGFINQGLFYGGANYAYMNATGTYVRAASYGSDTNFVTVGAGATIGANTGKHLQITGAISAQTTISVLTLKISGANNLTLTANQTLTLSSGGLLKAGNNAATLGGGTGITTSGSAELVVRTDQSSDSLTISTPILSSTTGGLTKSGAGTLILSGIGNAYSGVTTVNAGTLDVQKDGGLGSGDVSVASGATLKLELGASNNYINDSAKLLLNGTAAVNLAFTGTDAISGLSFDGITQAVGTWGAIGSAATHQSSRFTGSGILSIAGVATITTVSPSVNPSTYGQSVTFTATVTGSGPTPTGTVTFKDAANTLATVALDGTAHANFTTNALAAASHPITAVYNGDTIFDDSTSSTLTETVNPQALTITANSISKTYGQTVTFAGTEFISSGLVNSDTVTSVTLTSGGAPASATVAGSAYPIVPSNAIGTGLGNYTITYTNGSLTVTVKPLTITANSTSKMYGQTVTFAGTEFTPTGLVNGDTVTGVTLTSAGAPATAAVAGSPYTIVPSDATGTGLGNYTITYTDGALAVSAQLLTITANSTNKVFGQSLTFAGTEFTASGLTNGDAVASVTLTSDGAAAAAASGSYSIVPSDATGTGLGNYAITYLNGVLAVNAAPTIGAITNRITYVDHPVLIKLLVDDAESPPENLQISLGTDNPTLVDPETFITKYYTGDHGNWYVTLVPTFGLTGTATNTVTVSDGTNSVSTSFVLTVIPPPHGAVRFANTSPITIPDSGPASLYPSPITVTGMSGIVTNLDVTISKFAHHFPDDVHMLLVGPTGQSVVIWSKCGGGNPVTNVTATLIAGGPAIPDSFEIWSEQFGPADYAANDPPANNTNDFPAPAPGAPYTNAVALSSFYGLPANGTWSLYVYDDYPPDHGIIDGGWSLMITTTGGQELTVTGIAAQDKEYDGTTNATINTTNAALVGVAGGDDVTLVTTGASGTFADKNVGTNKTVQIAGLTLTGADADKYTPTQPTTTAAITARTLEVSATVDAKPYDGTNDATVTLTDNRIGGDDLTVSYTAASFNNKNVGTSKPVHVVGIAVSGSDVGNYAFDTTTDSTGDITARAITVTAATDTKGYDGTASSSGTPTITSGSLASGDTVTWTQSFGSKNAGTGKTLIPTGTVSDSNSGNNYSIAFVDDTTGVITPASLVVTAAGVNKPYDGTTAAAVTLSDDRILGDSFTASYTSALFANKNAGPAKPITVTGIALTGTDAGNYSHNTTADASANITALSLDGSITAGDKVYDGTNTATITSYALSGSIISNDIVSLTGGSATFDDKNVGTAKPVTATGLTLTGADALNYGLNSSSANATASITPAALTVTADNKSRPFAQPNPPLTASFTGFASGDDTNVLSGTPDLSTTALTNSFSGSYPISVTNGTLTAVNYTFSFVDGTLTIGKALLTVTADDQSRTYGAANPIFTVSYSGFLDGDDTNVLSGLPDVTTAADTNSVVADSPFTISVTNGTLTATNYDFAFVSGSLTVTPAVVTITADSQSKIYGAAVPTLTASYTGFVNGEDTNVLSGTPDLSTDATATSPVVNSPYSITVTNGTLAADNYDFAFVSGSLAVTPAPVTGSITAGDKVYDGTNSATITSYALSGSINGDDVSLSGGSATFDDKNVGIAKLVTATGLGLNGTNADNYALSSTSASTNTSISARALVVSATGVNKPYDGTTAAAVTLSDDRILGDSFTASYTSALFANKNAGPAKPITVTGIALTGTDAGNYSHNTTAGASANITAIALDGSITAGDKVYDGTNTATITSYALSGSIISNDTVSLTGGSATFDDKNVGTAKPVTATGLTLTGADALNYGLNSSSASATASITPAALTIAADNKSRTQGLPNPLLTASYSGFVGGDDTNALTTPVSLSTTATDSSPVGAYPITANNAAAVNYTIGYADGTLTVSVIPQLGVGKSGNQIILTCPGPTLTNQSYQFEYKDDLGAATWTPLAAPISGTGASITFTNQITGQKGFFRVEIAPAE